MLEKAIKILNSMVKEGKKELTDGLITIEIPDLINEIENIKDQNKKFNDVISNAVWDLGCVIEDLERE